MKILFIGDIIGRTGRDALEKHLPVLREKLDTDFVIVNADNAAHGRGVTIKMFKDFLDLGVDCVTGGDHIWNQKEIVTSISRYPNLLRPHNYIEETPGSGVFEGDTLGGKKVVVIHLQGRVFMDPIECPFKTADKVLERKRLGHNADAIFVDFHAEATSEKMAMAQYLDGRVSAVIGTHTHIPTADCQIFPEGTAFQGDAGMTGDYNSVIGVKKEAAIRNLIGIVPRIPFVPAEEEATLCGTLVKVDTGTGKAIHIEPVRVGGRLGEHIPAF